MSHNEPSIMEKVMSCWWIRSGKGSVLKLDDATVERQSFLQSSNASSASTDELQDMLRSAELNLMQSSLREEEERSQKEAALALLEKERKEKQLLEVSLANARRAAIGKESSTSTNDTTQLQRDLLKYKQENNTLMTAKTESQKKVAALENEKKKLLADLDTSKRNKEQLAKQLEQEKAATAAALKKATTTTTTVNTTNTNTTSNTSSAELVQLKKQNSELEQKVAELEKEIAFRDSMSSKLGTAASTTTAAAAGGTTANRTSVGVRRPVVRRPIANRPKPATTAPTVKTTATATTTPSTAVPAKVSSPTPTARTTATSTASSNTSGATRYPLTILKDLDNLPDGVDRKKLDEYLAEEDFTEAFGCTFEEFNKLPNWRRSQKKKQAGLY